jgi:dATP pyrophosphohydrolase
MIPLRCKQIEVYLFRRRARRTEVLLIRRSAQRTLAHVWQPVTGGIERGETAWQAAAREVFEETGLSPVRWWALEHLTMYYEPATDAVHAVPLFAAEVAWTDAIALSDEHDRYAFLSEAAASKRVLWHTQRCALRAVRDEVLGGGAGATARDVTARIAARPPKGARRPTKKARLRA